MRPATVDHLVYAVAELGAGVAALESLLGVRAVIGGRHPQYGTHNALLSLGPATYLEIVAADPASARPERGRPFGVDSRDLPRLTTWAVRDEAIERRAANASAAGLELGAVQVGGRARPDGTLVSWRLTDPYAMPLDGLAPFVIAWGATPHPALTAPAAGMLAGLRVEHPEPSAVRKAFEALALDVDLSSGQRCAIIASLRVGRRIVELR